jgi:hypothetical protein
MTNDETGKDPSHGLTVTNADNNISTNSIGCDNTKHFNGVDCAAQHVHDSGTCHPCNHLNGRAMPTAFVLKLVRHGKVTLS